MQVVIKDKAGEQVGLYKKSHALIIGINDYTAGWPDLPGVKNDVKEIKNILEDHGFIVTVYENLKDRIELDKIFSEFIANYGQSPENRLLFYFAGHGHTEKLAYGGTMGYIVPADVPNPNIDNSKKNIFLSKAMDMQQIEVYAKRIQSKHALFIFDSCFSGSIFSLSRAVPQNINYKTALPVRQFVTSGSEDETVPDESIFRKQFVAALNGEGDIDDDGYVTVTELGEFLQAKVINYSKNTQHPQYGKIRDEHLDRGDFVFQLFATEPEKPAKKGFSLEDLEREADIIAGNKLVWDATLNDMKEAYNQVVDFQERDIPPDRKIVSWQRFLDTFAENNPYSNEDENMREEARIRIGYWQNKEKRLAASKQREETGRNELLELKEKKQYSEEHRDSVTGMEFVFVQGGCYQMGDRDGYPDENPVHKVCVDDFYIGKYEMTQSEWQKVMGNNPSHFNKEDNCPVENVSWNDVHDFIQKLNQERDGKYRLPTEAEWEYAARSGGKEEKWAGTSNESDLKKYAWYGSNSSRKTHSVGEKKPNGLGLYDMSGNVFEWCSDWYGNYYKRSPEVNPKGPPRGSYRVIRGGGLGSKLKLVRASYRGGTWHYKPRQVRASLLYYHYPDSKKRNIGFRLARTP